MKVTFNAFINSNSIETILKKQKEKMDEIDKFCKENKIEKLSYKDSELEYEYAANKQLKVETRPKQVNKEIRKGE